MAIPAITIPVPSTASSAPAAGAGAVSGFTQSLDRLVQATNQSDQQANAAVSNMVNGTGDIPEAMIALQQADLALQLTVQVRNKLVQAYQEIMRMSV